MLVVNHAFNSVQDQVQIDREKGNFHHDANYRFDAGTGLTEKTIDYFCDVKGDPDRIREFRKQ